MSVVRCELCGHALSRHNDSGNCVVYSRSKGECPCDGTKAVTAVTTPSTTDPLRSTAREALDATPPNERAAALLQMVLTRRDEYGDLANSDADLLRDALRIAADTIEELRAEVERLTKDRVYLIRVVIAALSDQAFWRDSAQRFVADEINRVAGSDHA